MAILNPSNYVGSFQDQLSSKVVDMETLTLSWSRGGVAGRAQ